MPQSPGRPGAPAGRGALGGSGRLQTHPLIRATSSFLLTQPPSLAPVIMVPVSTGNSKPSLLNTRIVLKALDVRP